MAAKYPDFPVSFSQKVDLTDLVVANDVNSLYDETTAIAVTVGLTPNQRSTPWTTGSTTVFDTTTTTYTNVSERIRNVENGTFITYNDYISRSAASSANTITPSGTTTVNLTLKAQTSQTANLLEAKDAAGTTTLLSVSPAGTLRAVLIDGGSA